MDKAEKFKKIRVGIIGAGRQGYIHSRNIMFRLRNRAELVCLSDINLDAANKLVESLGIYSIDVYDDFRNITAREDIDAVIIASSSDTHEEIITDACQAGKHIFCEKPIAIDLPTIDKLLRIVEKADVKFMVGFNRRFDPTFKRVREHVEKGDIGTPQILTITSRDPAPPHLEYLKTSGGIFFDCTVHDFDMARYLMADEVAEIYATGNILVDDRVRELGDLDTTMVTLKFKGGSVASINNSRQAVYGYDQRVEVFGSKGSVQAYNETPTRVVLFDEDGVHGDKPLYFNKERYPESFYGEMKAFIDSVGNDVQPLVSGKDGRIAVVMAMAARKSYEENRPVKLEL